MLNTNFTQNYKFTSPLFKAAICEPAEAKENKITETKDRYFRPSMVEEAYLYNIRKINHISIEKENQLGEKINQGRDVDNIINTIQNQSSLEKKKQKIKEIKELFERIAPEKAEQIISMLDQKATNKAILKFLLDGKTPNKFFKQVNVANDPLILKYAKIPTKCEDKPNFILNKLITTYKNGVIAQDKLAHLSAVKAAEGLTDSDCEKIRNNEIPEKYTKIKDKAKKAQDELVQIHLFLIPQVVSKIKTKLTYIDAVQEGSIGLIEAAKAFDYQNEKKARFDTFAAPYIEGYIKNASYNTDKTIKIPTHLAINMRKLIPVAYNYKQENGVDATAEELYKKTGISPLKQKRISMAYKLVKPVNLDAPLSPDKDDSMSIGSAMPSKEMPYDEQISRKQLASMLQHLLKNADLTEQEQEVLKLRQYTEETEPTFDEVGQILGVKRQRAHEIEVTALGKLKSLLQGSVTAEQMPLVEKRRIKKQIKSILSPEEYKLIETKYAWKDPKGVVLNSRWLADELRISRKKINPYVEETMNKLKDAGITEQQLLDCRDMSNHFAIVDSWKD